MLGVHQQPVIATEGKLFCDSWTVRIQEQTQFRTSRAHLRLKFNSAKVVTHIFSWSAGRVFSAGKRTFIGTRLLKQREYCLRKTQDTMVRTRYHPRLIRSVFSFGSQDRIVAYLSFQLAIRPVRETGVARCFAAARSRRSSGPPRRKSMLLAAQPDATLLPLSTNPIPFNTFQN